MPKKHTEARKPKEKSPFDVNKFHDLKALSDYLWGLWGSEKKPLKDKDYIRYIESETFGMKVQDFILQTRGVKVVNECLCMIELTSHQALKSITTYRGFNESVMAARMHEETDVEEIALTMELMAKVFPLGVEIVVEQSPAFDFGAFVEKLNNEPDMDKIIHSLDRISRNSMSVAKDILDSSFFDVDKFAGKLKSSSASGDFLSFIRRISPTAADLVESSSSGGGEYLGSE